MNLINEAENLNSNGAAKNPPRFSCPKSGGVPPKGANQFFFQFGGQGNSFLSECSTLFKNYPELEEFFETAFSAIRETISIDEFPYSEFFSHGFELKSWLMGEDLPPENVLFSCPVSLPSIHITQMAYYHLLELRGVINKDVLDNVIAITGHSQGIHSACLASMKLTGKEFYEAFRKFVQYYLYSGSICQLKYPVKKIDDGLLQISQIRDSAGPSPMAVITNIRKENLEEILNNFNRSLEAFDRLTISLENTDEIFVISGDTENVIKFREKNFELFQHLGYGWQYLEITTPFHSHFIRDGLEIFKKDLKKIDFQYYGSDLKIPVMNTFTGENMQGVSCLGEFLFELQVSRPLIWKNSIRTLVDNANNSQVIDFGPGKSSAFFTKQILQDKEVEILSATGRAGLRKLFALHSVEAQVLKNEDAVELSKTVS